MAQPDSYITIGKIGAPYGVKGWVKIITYTEFGENILHYSPWYLENHKGAWEPIEVQEGKLYGKGVLVKLRGIDTPEAAKLYTNRAVGIPRGNLPQLEEGEYYWSDLKGLKVYNIAQEYLGEVIYLMETGSNDVLVVKGQKEHAIPYLPGRVVLKIDLKKQEMIVDWQPI